LSFAAQALDDSARLEDEGMLFEEDEFLLELEEDALLEDEDSMPEDENAMPEDDKILLEDNCKALEDDSSLPKELLLIETKPLEYWFPTELELAGTACSLEDESSSEPELANSSSSGNFKVQEINIQTPIPRVKGISRNLWIGTDIFK
jgi:hypothetical protein